MTYRLGIQLYSVKEAAEADLLDTIRRVGKMGYDGVEFAGFFGHAVSDIRRVMREAGVQAAGSHVPYDQLKSSRLMEILDDHRELGCSLVICPYLEEHQRRKASDYRLVAAELNRIGEACNQAGITFGYHHHDFELADQGGITGLEILMEETHPQWVKLELDVFWAVYMGRSPLQLLEKYGNRITAIHMKDLTQMEGQKISTEIGRGEIDPAEIVEAAQSLAIPWVIVEQEHFEQDPMMAAQENARRMRPLMSR
ncbi:sugar phosphate isomerase [Marinithermofilum abyssi]|uniref:Sugar phosphate isomerase n=1 Tax=Marinithermofilum abyssi TaxID=1571185 RepID=A0A8J2VGN3_9BACL|nr:sugar phosphate isomerase/epimerase [Marinithermofilum abyssi]GGE08592.1 sugar phosphate isomerase [Marinithermofilum abyssi]